MMQSPYPLEVELGMRYYGSDTPPIGGRLRAEPEDFIVEEIPREYGDAGSHLLVRLTKKNWELQRAVKEIAKRLGISHRRIGWAGTKDKNAVTSQIISIYNVTPEAVEAVRLTDITLTVVGRAPEPLALGALEGNRFAIVIRDCDRTCLAERVERVTGTVAEGIPNYYGVQRFGVARPVTHRVGEHILQGDYAGAVTLYVGAACPGEAEAAQRVRSRFTETGDVHEALATYPVQMTYERAMLHHLAAHPDDYAGALQQLPPKLLSLLVSAFQSYLFNCALSRRLDEGHTLSDPIPGDRLLFANGREDIATERNLRTAVQHLSRGRCRIALFIPGAEPAAVHGRMDEILQEILARREINRESFKEASRFVQMRYSGALRPIALSTEVDAGVSDDTVTLRFTLPPGHYATTVCREYMKAEPLRMI
ncbi:tRNA pseudouridine(13) synthase TruD [Methanoculleus sp. FWC-SCC1]|uniref:Probable tRNA pseudouridine synthase D n=1 Tax=Methanoculleus frigidifontis TaxID=2584085 RepID=A0ABT8M7K3_9EURY|nr:tRNA pseudouridine(13) synthase TruD [Methanoculleus sp. FWC-SCC1]MDN7023910.1 tRNA pseudouridine(13) synthase TruD [Methanoculleus sp. FWC-SCC1]